ncbi:MAG TPA: ATP-binding protein [Phycisphaerae bacterium]|jgi:signal transduction histidine kinase
MFRRDTPVAAFVVMMLGIIAVILFTTLGIVDHLSESAGRRAALRADTQLLADQLAASLSLPVWNFDHPQIDKIVDGAMNDRETCAVAVQIANVTDPGGIAFVRRLREPDGRVNSAPSGTVPADAIMEQRLIKANGDTVGTLQLYVTTRFLEETLWTQLRDRILIVIAFGAILIASLYLLLWRTVLQPLGIIERYATEVSSGGAAPAFHARRRFRGELERLRISIQKMVDLLAGRYAARAEAERLLEIQLRYDRLVANISAQLVAANPGNVDGILTQSLTQIAELLNADRIVLGQTDPATGEMVARAHFRRSDPPFPDRLIISQRYPALWRDLLTGNVSNISDVQQLPDFFSIDRDHFLEVGIQSQVTVPVLINDHLRYILAVASAKKSIWSSDLVARIKVISNVLATTALRCSAELEAAAYLTRVRDLATELTRSEERQRRELAAVLQDEVGQNLFAATTQLLAARNRANGSASEIDGALALLDQASRDTRELTFELCPPVLYQMGLAPALQRLVDLFAKRYTIKCVLSGTGNGPADLNLRGLAYQGVRELLSNAARHAKARQILVHLAESGGNITITVTDDGVGFDASILARGRGGFGLFQLSERIALLGGSLKIDSHLGAGTKAEFTLPLGTSIAAE